MEQKVEDLKNENFQWEEKFKQLEAKYEEIAFQLKMEKRSKMIIQSKPSTNQNAVRHTHRTCQFPVTQISATQMVTPKRVKRQINKIMIEIPPAIEQSVHARSEQVVHVPRRSELDFEPDVKSEGPGTFGDLNDYIKVDTPTAKKVEKMALSRKDSLFNFFNL